MKQELIGPAASIAAAILARHAPVKAMLENDVIADAFLQAHQALLMGIARVEQEEKRPPMQISDEALRAFAAKPKPR